MFTTKTPGSELSYDILDDDIGSFGSSCDDPPETLPLYELYEATVSKFESLFKRENYLVSEDIRTDLDGLFLQLRLWAKNSRVESGSLIILDQQYDEEAIAVRLHLQDLLPCLQKVESADLPSQELQYVYFQRREELALICAMTFRYCLERLRDTLRALADLAEPIHVLIDIHLGEGTHSRIKNLFSLQKGRVSGLKNISFVKNTSPDELSYRGEGMCREPPQKAENLFN
jgi:hypothetical protein